MKSNQSSITAENNAVLRAYEFLQPKEVRICEDPYATYFLPERFLSIKDVAEQMHQTISDWEARFPGVCNSIIARTRFIDDCLTEALKCGIQQLIILGAGYDTRAFRFETLKNSVTVFEVDHPATQKIKLERINRYLKADLSNVRYIPIDFNTEALDVKLLSNGYDENLESLFIWEGVTYYIPASAVDFTLSFIAKNRAAMCSVVFDYFPPSVANGTSTLPEARALRDGLKQIGEEIFFGIVPERISNFMAARGFRVIRNLTSIQYKQAYFKGENNNRDVSEMFVFVQAKIL